MGKMVIFSAPSGAGKTTIVHKMLEIEPFNLAFSVSATSRKPRENEVNGKDYYFLTVDDFKRKIANDEFVEWVEVYENQFYGTLKSEIERLWKEGKNVVFDVDVIGGLNIKKQYPEQALSIFIKPPSLDELKRRLLSRGTEDEESLAKRLERAKYEMSFEDKFDIVIVNDGLQAALKQTEDVLREFLLQ